MVTCILPTCVIHADFCSASCVQQLIIPERLNQIKIVEYGWKDEVLIFPTLCHSSNSVTVSNYRGQAMIVAQHVSKKCSWNQYYISD